MNKDHELRKELERLAPTLHRLKATEPTPPPPGYFDGLPDEVLRRLRAEEASGLLRHRARQAAPARPAWRAWLGGWLWRPAAAMAVLALLVVAVLQWGRYDEHAAPGVLAEVPADALETYVESRLDEFGEELLMEVAPADELTLTLPIDDGALDAIDEELLDELSTDELEQLL